MINHIGSTLKNSEIAIAVSAAGTPLDFLKLESAAEDILIFVHNSQMRAFYIVVFRTYFLDILGKNESDVPQEQKNATERENSGQ